MKFPKIISIPLLLMLSMPLQSKTWIHGQVEYVNAIPQVQSTMSGQNVETLDSGFETEVYHNFKFFPNIKFDMYSAKEIKQNNKTLYYSSYFNTFHIDLGWTNREVDYRGEAYDYDYIMTRIKSKMIKRTIASFTYNYELEGKVNEYLVDIDYVLPTTMPIMFGFQYKSSKMLFNQDDSYETEGIFLKLGLKF